MTTTSPTRPTAPLPSAAVEALSRLERALLPAAVVVAVTRYEVASERTAELSHLMDARDLTPAEFNALFDAQTVMAGARTTLAEAGRLDLIEVPS
ncbi:hypothetical protein ABZ819_05165 [Streptomyces venezuelae]|uniref:hypothetical protein n=1 Tax=Streptomyces venezuelae TaxID=54571 RepID=UPI003448F179